MALNLKICIHLDGDTMGIRKELENVEAVLFDLDGTIVDSMWMWKNIDIEYLGSLGLKCPEDLQKCIEGMSFYETAVYFKDRFGIDDSLQDIMECWNDMAYEKYQNEVMLKTGVYDFIKYLKENGYKLGIATSNSRRLAYASLISREILEYFGVVLTGDECGKGKPEPDVYINSAMKLGVDPSKCLVFEDLPAGITAGKRAGMKTVAVWDQYSDYLDNTKREMADYYITDYKEIMDEIHCS